MRQLQENMPVNIQTITSDLVKTNHFSFWNQMVFFYIVCYPVDSHTVFNLGTGGKNTWQKNARRTKGLSRLWWGLGPIQQSSEFQGFCFIYQGFSKNFQRCYLSPLFITSLLSATRNLQFYVGKQVLLGLKVFSVLKWFKNTRLTCLCLVSSSLSVEITYGVVCNPMFP